ncbi:hypothetical protein AX16_004586 [Volvariella volvacea WC 439]|nr:hypothetical protein AX16_004586 [Volvariella volvacea WC 439]
MPGATTSSHAHNEGDAHVVVESVPFSTSFKTKHMKNILARDKARAHKILADNHLGVRREVLTEGAVGKQRAQNPGAGVTSVDVTDAAVSYNITIGVGQPPTEYTLIIDTGSSNTWVGANTPYKPTSTSQPTHHKFNVTYGSGQVQGYEYVDRVSMGKNLVLKSQSIGVATKAEGFNDIDGILGIGPVDLTKGTVSSEAIVPTVMDTLYSQKTITTESIGISFIPTTDANVPNGELTFGGVDQSKLTGQLQYVPITKTSPARKYWGVDQTLTYGKGGNNGKVLVRMSAGILDTGTTLLLLATEAFQEYQNATGAVMDPGTGLLSITQDEFNQLESLYFKIGSVTYEFTPNAQIWPRNLNEMMGGQKDKIYLIVADLGTPMGSGLDFINGFAWLQRFYTVYDTTHNQIGIATTKFTNATTN